MAALMRPIGLQDDLRVLVVAGDPLARAGLSTLLADQCTVVGAVDSPTAESIAAYNAAVLLWDLGYTPALAIEQIADLRESGLDMLALLPDESSAGEAWSAGVRGLLLRRAGGEMIAAGLTAVAQGLIVLDPALSTLMLGTRDRATIAPLDDALTARELQVLQLLAEGLPNKVIAARLKISEHTVKFHVNAILSKLGVQSRTEAVVRAGRLGLIIL
jgi:DNA-binding NarL/FixJ family response regulator